RSNGVPASLSVRVAATASRMMLPLYPPHSPRLDVTTNSSDFFTGRVASSGWLTSPAFWLRSAANSAILRVYASASVARSSAFLNRAVAISSIVLVIFRMFRTALRRFTSARRLGIGISHLVPTLCVGTSSSTLRVEFFDPTGQPRTHLTPTNSTQSVEEDV